MFDTISSTVSSESDRIHKPFRTSGRLQFCSTTLYHFVLFLIGLILRLIVRLAECYGLLQHARLLFG